MKQASAPFARMPRTGGPCGGGRDGAGKQGHCQGRRDTGRLWAHCAGIDAPAAQSAWPDGIGYPLGSTTRFHQVIRILLAQLGLAHRVVDRNVRNVPALNSVSGQVMIFPLVQASPGAPECHDSWHCHTARDTRTRLSRSPGPSHSSHLQRTEAP